ncbi:hypothetical protein ACVLD2_003324 [Paenibacillus sp. PvR052]
MVEIAPDAIIVHQLGEIVYINQAGYKGEMSTQKMIREIKDHKA